MTRADWWRTALLSAAPVPLIAVERDWSLVHATDEFLGRAGVGREVLGRPLWEIFPELAGTPNERHIRAAMADGVEHDFVSGGSYGWFRVHARPVSGGLLISLLDVTDQKTAELRAERLAAEHGMLRRVAEAVVRGMPQSELFDMIAREIGQLLGVRAASVGRDIGGTHTEVLGNWSADDEIDLRLGVRLSDPDHEFRRALTEGRPIRSTAAEGSLSRVFAASGCQAAFAVPIYAGGRLWGGLITASMDPHAYEGDDARHQIELGELTGLAIGNAEAHEQLLHQATSDPLTGLVNHRAFHEGMRSVVARARVTSTPLSLAVLDIDDFRVVNEMRGHRAGDRLLVAAAGALRQVAGERETLARVGGDEFAILFEGKAAEAALVDVERARAEVAAVLTRAESAPVTVSAGVCDLAAAGTAEQLFELADGALYWSKAHGRDRACVFDPEVVRELSATDRARHFERSRTLVGITALARAIDAKNPATARHSDRVAALATRLAAAAGWTPAATSRLHEAALVHDVGKIGVPDAILLKPGRLDPAEYEIMKRHASLGANMLEGVLSDEQVTWVRAHHERPDGKGYPDGLGADEIDDGSALLAQADAFEAMVTRRVYSPARGVEDALRECVELSGRQFMPVATAALQALYDDGSLHQWASPQAPAEVAPVPPQPGAAAA